MLEHSKSSVTQMVLDAVRDPTLPDQLRQDSEREKIQRRLMQRIGSAVRVHFPADEIEVQFVADAKRGSDFDARHELLNVSARVIETIRFGTDNQIAQLTKDIQGQGGFLMSYKGVGEQRIENRLDSRWSEEGGWVMAETSGRPVNSETNWQPGERIVGGDGHFWVPPDREIDLGDLPLPIADEDVVLEGEKIIEEILSDPACAVLIADICATTPKMGFASATEDVALHQISLLNATRRHQLKYAIAAIASVKGLENEQGEPIGREFDPGLLNVASVILHTRANLPGCMLGRQTNRKVSATLPDGTPVSLLVDWYITAQKLAGIQPRKDVRFLNSLFTV